MRIKTIASTVAVVVLATGLLWLLPGDDKVSAGGEVYVVRDEKISFHGLPTELVQDLHGSPGMPVCVETPDGREVCIPVRGIDPATASEEEVKNAIRAAARRGVAELNTTASVAPIDLDFSITDTAEAQIHCNECGSDCGMCCFSGWFHPYIMRCLECGEPTNCERCVVSCPAQPCNPICP